MIVMFREFRSRAGGEGRALTALRKRAATMIHRGGADAVVVCQRVDLPECVLWIQHHLRLEIPAVDGVESLQSMESGLLESAGALVRLEFVDGMYHFPLPRCGVWAVETNDEEAVRALVGASQRAATDGRIGGISIYRTAEDPSRVIAFLALASGVAPANYLELVGHERLTLYPLRVSWTIGRLAPGTVSSCPPVRYPRAAFWARLGQVSLSETATGARALATEASGSQRI